ncbi:MAG: hypothetical protein ACJ76J_13330 [Thermoanaerobaculia bacterium]
MHRAGSLSSHPRFGRQPRQGLGHNLRSFTAATADLLTAAGAAGRAVLGETMRSLPPRTCAFPPAHCPDPCVGTIVQEVFAGEVREVPIQARNGTNAPRTYTFHIDRPLRNSRGDEAGVPNLAPPQLSLRPGETGLVRLRLNVGESFHPGFSYSTEAVIASRGCADQLLEIQVLVLTDDGGPGIALGCPCDPPVRPLLWYHHFYCDKAGPDKPLPLPQVTLEEAE